MGDSIYPRDVPKKKPEPKKEVEEPRKEKKYKK